MYAYNILKNTYMLMLILFILFTGVWMILDKYVKIQNKKNKLFKNII